MLPIMFYPNPLICVTGLLSGFLYYVVKNEGRGVKKVLWFFLIPIIGSVINALFMHNGMTVLFILNNNPITLEAALYGLTSGTMIAAMLMWFASFNQIMTSDKLLYIFGSVSPKVALILSMTLRYIPLYRQQITKTNNAQKAMGLYKEDNLIDKMKSGVRVFSIMVTWALENGVITADSMTARGYGIGKRSRFAIFKWEKQDIILLCSSLIFLTAVFAAGATGNFGIEWYPSIVTSENSLLKWTGFALFVILCLIPDYMQIKEEARWRSLQSKI